MAAETDNQILSHEIVGMRITVFNLLPDFLDPTKTEGYIAKFYGLTAEQVSAARAYIFRNLEMVLERHLEIEARNAAGNPNPEELDERTKKTHATMQRFKQWLQERDAEEAKWSGEEAERRRLHPDSLPSFREWLTQQDSPPIHGS